MSPSAEGHPKRTILIKGPKGPCRPSRGFSKKTRIVPKSLESHVDMSLAATKQQKFCHNSPGVARTFFSFYVIITLTLRFRLRYVTVAGATFPFTLRYRSGREAHRGSRCNTR
jgi:hypothetical protein